jgi:ASC-1-like (ASCH) protein
MAKPANGTEKDLDIQILVGVIGVILSVVLHELFHIFVHWGHIRHISLFPSLGTIVQIDVLPSSGSDIEGEELIAYGITLLVLLITVMIIFKIRDTNDKRSSGQILFPKDSNMQKIDPIEMLELSGLDQIKGEVHVHEIGINNTVLKQILNGKKTIETRLAKERFLNFNVGDEISIREDIWKKGEITRSIPNQARIVVTNVQHYTSFREMFNHIDYKSVMPSANDIDEAVDAYKQYYSLEDEKQLGVVAISFQLIDPDAVK